MGLACLLCSVASAQLTNPPSPGVQESPFAFRTWRTGDGLPQDSVSASVQTRDGYLWVGTSGGLARFDGVRFEVFGRDEGLPNLQVRALLEDRDGALWIGTGHGLCRLREGRFTSWTTQDGLAGNIVKDLMEDRGGAIWIGTTLGLSRWRNGQLEKPGPPGVGDRWIRALVIDRNGALWIAARDAGLMRWDGRAFVPATDSKEIQAIRPSSLARDRAGRIWAADGPRIVCIDGRSMTRYGPGSGLPGAVIACLAGSSDGAVWAGTVDQGLYCFRDGRFQAVRQADSTSDDAVQTVMEDREHSLWVGTSGGGLTQLSLKHYKTLRILEERSEVCPLSLAETDEGGLWVGTRGHGLYRFVRGLEPGLREKPLTTGPDVQVVFTTRDGGLWYDNEGMLCRRGGGGALTAHPGDQVRCVCEDGQAGLWVGTENGKLFLLRAGQREECSAKLPPAALTALCQGPDGTLWIGSYGGGLGRLKDGRCTVFGKQQGLGSDIVRTLHLDSHGTLWIGTEGGGLSCFKEGGLKTFNRRHGLIDDSVVQILEDDGGCLWLGTHRGIARVSLRELDDLVAGTALKVHARAWTRANGLLSEQCAVGFNSGLKTRAGLLCFSTVRGIVVIDPKRESQVRAPTAVWLEEVLLDGQKVSLPPRSPVGIALNAGAPLKVPPGRPRLEFRYTGLEFSAPEKVHFRYRLEGLDADWVQAGTRRSAYYNFVPPGNYRFQVIAHNSDGVWGESGWSFGLIVLPHFWQTWWFLLSAGLACVGVIAGTARSVTRRRMRRRLERLEQQNAIEKERTRIARDLHDELGAKLARISFQGATAKRFLDSPAKAGEEIEKMSQGARDLVTSLDEIVWAVEPENDSLEGLVTYLCRYAGEFFDNSPVSCQLNIPPELPPSRLRMDVRHNMYLAVKEAFSNVLKHSGASQVELTISANAHSLEILVADNGRGISPGHNSPPDKRKRAGHGLTNIRERVESVGGGFKLDTGTGRGTRVRLSVPLAETPV